MGTRKSSEFLSHILDKDKGRNHFFVFFFHQVAAKADRKCALHSHDQHRVVNTVAEEPLNPAIAAI